MDLRSGTFVIPSCNQCEISIELAAHNLGLEEQPRELGNVGSINAAIIPYRAGMPHDRPTYTYRLQRTTGAGGNLAFEGIEIPKRATSYRAWTHWRDNSTLVTSGDNIESREWRPDGSHEATASIQAPNETLALTASNVPASEVVVAFVQFYLSP